MTQYDFTTRPNRVGQLAKKWLTNQDNPHLLQMWVADMDFQPLPEVRQALKKYAEEEVFGYPYFKDSLYQAIIDWEKDQHGYAISKEDILLIEGVVPAFSIVIQAYTQENDSVLINTPVYPPFSSTVRLNKRQLVTNSLVERNGQFEIDFEQLERDIVDNQVKLYLFCSPHNPGGRVWTEEELRKIGHICQKHGVTLVSDEIHQDLTLFGNKHHSFNTLDPDFKEFTVILASATKTFNIAGTKNSFVIIENSDLRKKFYQRQLMNNHHEIATVGLIATETVLTQGHEWLAQLKEVLETNVQFVADYLTEHSQIRVMKPQGTYLLWLDFSAYGLDHQEVHRRLLEEAQVVLNDGLTFGKEGKYHARFNAASPFITVKEACERIVSVFGK
ncbi:TPA: MalY/PatB family protein [Streptococcus suis]